MKYLIAIFGFVLCLLAISVVTGVTQQSTTAAVTVNEFLSVTLSNDPVSFLDMDPGTTGNASVNNGFPLTATIGSESNVDANVTTKADNVNFCTDYSTCSGDTFAVSNMEWSDVGAGTYIGYTTLEAQVCGSVVAGGTCDVYHKLSIPAGQKAGTYSTGITITAVKA